MAIEELQNLDRHLPPIVEAVAKFGCGEMPFWGLLRQLFGGERHRLDRRSRKKMVVSYFLDLSPLDDMRNKQRTASSSRAMAFAISRTRGGR